MSTSTPHHRTGSTSSRPSTKNHSGAAASMPSNFNLSFMPPMPKQYFEPCAATASMFLYAQGNSVVCCHHDTLTIERRFLGHKDDIMLLAADNHNQWGAGRMVVSHDAGQTTIVWDLMTGKEITKFTSYGGFTAVAWINNGNIAFGNTQGNIILFEPTTEEHITARTIDQMVVTALAPASDCRTFAIGYQNGILLIATLQPNFSIIHHINNTKGPSPIVTLAWHASSVKQKSDMLAVQHHNGDLRVWSVPKSHRSDEQVRPARILHRGGEPMDGPNWMAWSKNGRIIQYSGSTTLSWDVRTKQLTYDRIPTLESVRGLAVYGPGATLFTLGANNTVQQFDLNSPALMVGNVHHPANLLPPSPPSSQEEHDRGGNSQSESETLAISINAVSESDEDHMSPLARIAQGTQRHQQRDIARFADREGMASSATEGSTKSLASVSFASTSSRTPGNTRYPSSAVSRGLSDRTYFSVTTLNSAPLGRRASRRDRDTTTTATTGSVSSASISSSQHKPSRLRNEVPRSPEHAGTSKVDELFKFTRTRLTDMPYQKPGFDKGKLTNDDLRQQMLSTIFGWQGTTADLVRDEISSHPLGSPASILLSKWLSDMELDILNTSSSSMTSSDWMLLALSNMGSHANQKKLGRAYVQRLLEHGDVHTAATIMLGLGDHSDAIEIYVSHKRYMEALILTCLVFPSVWERQSEIVARWGDYAVQTGEKMLAIRCYACAGRESTEPWTSPSALQMNFRTIPQSIPEVLSPPLSPPNLNRGPQRSIAKSASLKLITTFTSPNARVKYFPDTDAGQTPIAAGATPLAESAASPAGMVPTTALLRPSQASTYNTPASARRPCLPSIGETAFDVKAVKQQLDRAGHAQGRPSKPSQDLDSSSAVALEPPRTANSSPIVKRLGGRAIRDSLPSPSPQSLAALMEGPTARNGPRTRIPDGISLAISDTQAAADRRGAGGGDAASAAEVSSSSAAQPHWPRRRGPGSVSSSVTSNSASSLGNGQRGRHGRRGSSSLDAYIHSLDAATQSRARTHGDNSRKSSRERSRGRASTRGYTTKGGKRSPTSPVPMSPEDLINLSTPKVDNHPARSHEHTAPLIDLSSDAEPGTVRKRSQVRRAMPRVTTSRNSDKASSSRPPNQSGRTQSQEPRWPTPQDGRDRSRTRGTHSTARSPVSHVPMSAIAMRFGGSEDEEDYRRAVEAQEKFRQKSNRSGGSRSRDAGGSTSVARNRSHTRPRHGTPHSEQAAAPAAAKSSDMTKEPLAIISFVPKETITPISSPAPPALPLQQPAPLMADHVGDLRSMQDERRAKKVAAARELEERRRSLAQRPQAPSIPHPSDLPPPESRRFTPDTSTISPSYAPAVDPVERSQTAEPAVNRNTSYQQRAQVPTRPQIGLPATPKAMRLIHDGARDTMMPPPIIPTTFAEAASPQSRNCSPTKSPEGNEEDQGPSALTLLPSTVYSPPSHLGIPRSMSAPPVEQRPLKSSTKPTTTGHGSRGHDGRKMSIGGEALSGPTATQQQQQQQKQYHRWQEPIGDHMVPPPPPPPLLLKELQHLAVPPPPPPLHPGAGGRRPSATGGQLSGKIEIVMDDEPAADALSPSEVASLPGSSEPAPTMAAAPVPPPPPPPSAPAPAPPQAASSRGSHRRARSSNDNSLAGRISRATERMMTVGRGRSGTAAATPLQASRSSEKVSPYESVPPIPYSMMLPPPLPQSSISAAAGNAPQSLQYDQQQQPHPSLRTGLHQSEMI